jgi:hypothetical protein
LSSYLRNLELSPIPDYNSENTVIDVS